MDAECAELARAKINLTLRVLGRRNDGFHELDSIVAFADVGDRLTLTPGPTADVSMDGPFAADIMGENLVARALHLLRAQVPELNLGHIVIDKQLPVAAGIGGGSADAAAALRLVRRANPGAAGQVDWVEMAAALGSDVPVCLADRACRMTGRGDALAEIQNFASLPAVLVNPQVPVPADKTRQVFKMLAAAPVPPDVRAADVFPVTHAAWLTYLHANGNDLEGAAMRVVPAIADVLKALKAHPLALLARLSGAGPTCFALTASTDEAATLAREIQARHAGWWVRATCLT